MTTPRAWTALPLPADPGSGAPYVVTEAYGTRGGAHKGVDLATRDAQGRPTTGLPVYAVTTAVVARVVDDVRGGLVVVLESSSGDEVKYMHLESARVAAGDVVLPGEELGRSGASGQVTGPHLHLEVWVDGRAVDPAPYLAAAAAALPTSRLSPVVVVGGLSLAGLLLWALTRR